jgi:hypothetical protein
MGRFDSSTGKYTSPFSEKLLVDAFKKARKRLDMGKCCLHFKQLDRFIHDAAALPAASIAASAAATSMSLPSMKCIARR